MCGIMAHKFMPCPEYFKGKTHICSISMKLTANSAKFNAYLRWEAGSGGSHNLGMANTLPITEKS